MQTLSLEPEDNLLTIAGKLQKAEEGKIGFPLSSVFPFTQNLVNLKIIKKEAARLGKEIVFLPQDKASRELILSLTNGQPPAQSAFGFVVGREASSDPGQALAPRKMSVVLDFIRRWLTARSWRFGLWITAGLSALAVIGVTLYFLGSFWPQATVMLNVSAETFTKSIDLEASLSAERTDVKARLIPAVKLKAAVKGKNEMLSSGQKEVGEKAEGTVALYNKTDRGQLLKKGVLLRRITVLPGQDLGYLLNNEVNLPAREATATPQPGYIFGKAVGKVTAEKIGDGYNLPAGTTFLVGSYSPADVAAQNEAGFSGGSRREAKVVTGPDQEALYKTLAAELQNKLKAELRGRLVGDQKLEEGVITFTDLKKNFDKEVGEEADKFSLELEEEAVAFVYSQKELQDLLTAVLAELVPPAYELSDKDQSVVISGVQAAGTSPPPSRTGALKITAKVRGYITPRLDLAEIKKQLSGRTLAEADSYLSTLAGVDAHRLTLWPNLAPFRRLPRWPQRIEIAVEKK